jgi:TDG/mug DNA glycosylase family protein
VRINNGSRQDLRLAFFGVICWIGFVVEVLELSPVSMLPSKLTTPMSTPTVIPWKPTREQILAAEHKIVRDVIAPELRVLFSGINPGLYTAAVGHHFARPGNRFWKALYDAEFTERLLSPFEERELLKSGYGVTNVVARATATADRLSKEEIIQGGQRLRNKVRRYRPKVLAILGLGAYRLAFNQPGAIVGRQELKIGDTIVWVLPNPSGLNANYQPKDLARLFRQLRTEVL